jgi:hypothetical protein
MFSTVDVVDACSKRSLQNIKYPRHFCFARTVLFHSFLFSQFLIRSPCVQVEILALVANNGINREREWGREREKERKRAKIDVKRRYEKRKQGSPTHLCKIRLQRFLFFSIFDFDEKTTKTTAFSRWGALKDRVGRVRFVWARVVKQYSLNFYCSVSSIFITWENSE